MYGGATAGNDPRCGVAGQAPAVSATVGAGSTITGAGNTATQNKPNAQSNHPGNQTRFVVVARDGIPAPTGHDRTAMVVYQRADEPGSLISILQEFAARRPIGIRQCVGEHAHAGARTAAQGDLATELAISHRRRRAATEEQRSAGFRIRPGSRARPAHSDAMIFEL